MWNIGGSPKLCQFLWSTGALATNGRLMDRHIIEDGSCNNCQGGKETIIHDIFHYSIVHPVWEKSPFTQYILDGPNTSFVKMFVWLKSQLDA